MATTMGEPHAEAEARSIASGRRMTDLEAVMWYVEKDPHLASTFGTITLLDQVPDVDRLGRRLARMAAVVPRLHQRVISGPPWLAPPVWQDDPDFDFDYHVRRVAVPDPGDRAALFDLACRFVQDPFDRRRPLWQYLVVEGVEGSKAALVQKMHHAITDGIGGVRLAEQFVDLTRDASEPAPASAESVVSPEPERDAEATVLAGAAYSVRRTADLTWQVASGVLGDVRHPSRALARPAALVAAAESTGRQLLITDHARSPLWTERTLQRGMSTFDVDFDDARRAAKALGGSLNDLFITATAGGVGDYHRRHGAAVDELRMAMPVSTRTDRSAGGNAFVPTRMLVPVGITDPVARFAAVHDVLSRVRQEPAIGLAAAYAGVARLFPISVLAGATRRQTEAIDFTCSNVRTAPFDLFVGGARIEATYALGPLAGTAFNLTMLSYRGMLNLGLHVDPGAIADPGLLQRCLAAGFAEVIAAGA
jgi:diacylglycerol O-acyltransferase / wax synthase